MLHGGNKLIGCAAGKEKFHVVLECWRSGARVLSRRRGVCPLFGLGQRGAWLAQRQGRGQQQGVEKNEVRFHISFGLLTLSFVLEETPSRIRRRPALHKGERRPPLNSLELSGLALLTRRLLADFLGSA